MLRDAGAAALLKMKSGGKGRRWKFTGDHGNAVNQQ
jgi:hypothetical protein